MKKQKKYLDIRFQAGRQKATFFGDQSSLEFGSILFSRGKKTDKFFTEDSRLYITPSEQKLLREGVILDRGVKKWDNLSSRVVHKFVRYQPSQTSILLDAFEKRYQLFNESAVDATRGFLSQFSTVRLWNASIIGSILFGMILMTFVYRYLGQGASAKQLEQTTSASQQLAKRDGAVLGAADTADDAESFARQVAEIEQIKSEQLFESEVRKMVKGYPIEDMVPYIVKNDRTVAAFMIAIAKKESDWGNHVPVLNGQDCYNYWGYRAQRKLMGSGGHTCFNSPQDAVESVARRITTLVEEKGKDTPKEMVLWKCGSSCAATGGQAAANKWISDVTMYFDRLNTDE